MRNSNEFVFSWSSTRSIPETSTGPRNRIEGTANAAIDVEGFWINVTFVDAGGPPEL